MTLPNFLILGAAKSGTSSLWKYLKQHPQVFMSFPKEPNFFVFEGCKLPPYSGPGKPEVLYQRLYRETITNFQEYQSIFNAVTDEKAIGEASVRYLYFPQAPEKIKHYLGEPKLLILLRNPIERLYSHYMMNIRHILEPLSFAEALAQEEKRIAVNWGWDWHYVGVSSYYEQVKRYFDIFDREQIKVIIYDDFRQDTVGTMQSIYRFLDIDDSFIPNTKSRNRAGYWPKSMLLHKLINTPNAFLKFAEKVIPSRFYNKLLKNLKDYNKGPIPKIPTAVNADLAKNFAEKNKQLEDLLGRELPW